MSQIGYIIKIWSIFLFMISYQFFLLHQKVYAYCYYSKCSVFNPCNIDIFCRLIILCGVQLDPRPRFTICTYRNETDCLYLLVLNISHERESGKCHSTTPKPQPLCSWATFLLLKQKMKLPSKPNEQDIQYPITSFIFVIESQFCAFTQVFRVKEASSYIYFAIEETLFFFLKWLHCN